MPRVLGQPPLAGGFSMSAVQGSQGCPGPFHLVPVLRLPASDIGHGGYDFPGHAEAAGDVVSGDVVCGEPEERSQRTGLAAGSRAGEL